jgi:hypothetical protein
MIAAYTLSGFVESDESGFTSGPSLLACAQAVLRERAMLFLGAPPEGVTRAHIHLRPLPAPTPSHAVFWAGEPVTFEVLFDGEDLALAAIETAPASAR